MRRAALVAAAALLAACGAPAPIVGPAPGVPPAGVPDAPPAAVPSGATAVLSVVEAVPVPEQDVAAYVKVFVNGQEAGATATAPKSQDKKWGAVLPPGNHLFRFELWMQPQGGDWTPLAVQWQPPERFIRVEPGQRTLIALKFLDGGRRHELRVARERLP